MGKGNQTSSGVGVGLKHGQMASNRCWAQAAMVLGCKNGGSEQNK
jgi:hypothetical protein